jgi:hypothetical protein
MVSGKLIGGIAIIIFSLQLAFSFSYGPTEGLVAYYPLDGTP